MSSNPGRLTSREKEVLAFLTAGKTNAEIAASLNISPSTVKTHLSSIFSKLDVSNRTEAGLVGLRIFAPSALTR
jgi:NarL family two-component system response regulator LiaR